MTDSQNRPRKVRFTRRLLDSTSIIHFGTIALSGSACRRYHFVSLLRLRLSCSPIKRSLPVGSVAASWS
jgi:hypothetical protein